ncbi:hypothetical protein [Saccharopolyspora thermophila]|uniref:Uncharacterized protein n=1 Tax=Saccharopolyspora thermophila TaxID=89367 RepID=A0ABN1C0Y3_9PSEU
MAKTQFPVFPRAKGGLAPKAIGGLALVALFTFLVQHPTEAAALVRSGGSGLGGVVDALVTFFQALGR